MEGSAASLGRGVCISLGPEDVAGGAGPSGGAAAAAGTGAGAGSFQDNIKKTMEKLKESETNLKVCVMVFLR